MPFIQPRRAWQVGLAVLVVAGVAGLGVAQGAGDEAPQRVVDPATPAAFHDYRPLGPSAKYSGDVGSIGLMRPVRVVLAQRSDVVVSFSFRYRSSADPFVASLLVQKPDGPWRDTLPDERLIRPAERGDSTTLQFLVPDLGAGTYRFSLGVNLERGASWPARIRAGQVLVSGLVTPAPA